jgi:hypothetical protein
MFMSNAQKHYSSSCSVKRDLCGGRNQRLAFMEDWSNVIWSGELSFNHLMDCNGI